MRTRIRQSSKEYVGMPVECQRDVDMTQDPVELGFTLEEEDEPEAWVSGEWETIEGQTWAVALIGPGSVLGVLEKDRWWVHARVTDNPEVPHLTSPNRITIY
jgi:hypothetical protein